MNDTLNSKIEQLFEKLINLENRQQAMEIDLIDYMESSPPKSSMQWVEERVRALEDQMSKLAQTTLKTALGNKSWYDVMEHRVQMLEVKVND